MPWRGDIVHKGEDWEVDAIPPGGTGLMESSQSIQVRRPGFVFLTYQLPFVCKWLNLPEPQVAVLMKWEQ